MLQGDHWPQDARSTPKDEEFDGGGGHFAEFWTPKVYALVLAFKAGGTRDERHCNEERGIAMNPRTALPVREACVWYDRPRTVVSRPEGALRLMYQSLVVRVGYQMHCHDSLELGYKGWLCYEACAAAMHGHTIWRGRGGGMGHLG